MDSSIRFLTNAVIFYSFHYYIIADLPNYPLAFATIFYPLHFGVVVSLVPPIAVSPLLAPYRTPDSVAIQTRVIIAYTHTN